MTPKYQTLDAIADCFNPVIGIVALLVVARPFFSRNWASGFARLRTLAQLMAVVYALRFIDRAIDPENVAVVGYSTHTAFAVGVTAFICAHQVCWQRAGWVIGLLVYLGLVGYQGYHSLSDIAVSALLLIVACWGILWRDMNRIGRSTCPAKDSHRHAR